MDYEKQLKEALSDVNTPYVITSWIEENFPQLKESKDEGIRKAILTGLIDCRDAPDLWWSDFGGIPIDDCIAWLEKQGEQNPYSGTSFKYNGHTWGMCARDNGVEILFDGELKAFLSSENSFIYPIHPQPDLTPKNAMEAIKEEKVDNANKVEPKFKVDDFIKHNKANIICKVIAVDSNDNSYYVENIGIGGSRIELSNAEQNFHLWTIQDAKDGDVLVASDGSIFLFKGTIGCDCKHYVALTTDGVVKLNEGLEHCWENSTAVHPATKEQRDLLFQKIHEAGYEWDTEKKEPKKIHVIDEGKAEMDYCFTKMMNGEKITPLETKKFECPKVKIQDAIEVSSRMKYIDDDLKPIAEFIMNYASWNLHKDEWNQPVLEVPLFRVLDALAQRGKPYCCG